MDFEQDYLMRVIKQFVKALFSIILGKENALYELPLEEQYQSSEGFLKTLLDMINTGKINEAENMLYETWKLNDKKELGDAVAFYCYLNELDDVFLKAHDYSREEIQDGLKEISRRAGISNLTQLFDEP